ncbi:MAG: EAL domain-containing protein [Lachnospiraceae bacterium]|nr:EAL domain-containing protein [Lachnospiraceae bacterium]
MSNRTRVIGLCATRLNNFTRAEFLETFVREVKKNGDRTVIFHAFDDFFYETNAHSGAKSVFTNDLDVTRLDCMVICCKHFATMEIPLHVIQNCKNHGVPVLLLGGEEEGCYSVLDRYEDAYKELIRHAFVEHGVRDTFYIAGFPDNVYSDERVNCYKAVLEEQGLPFDAEKNLAHGYFWERPAVEITKDLLKREKMPEAIFCANDIMAIAVCRTLKENGVRVPEDVLVTGFDGIWEAACFSPSITTCREDEKKFATQTVAIVENEILKDTRQRIFYNDHIFVRGESCGCKSEEELDYRKELSKSMMHYASAASHEENIFNLLKRVIKKPTRLEVGDRFGKAIIEDSMVCFSSQFLAEIGELPEDMDADSLELLSIGYVANDVTDEFTYKRFKIEELMDDHKSMKLFNPIYVGDKVCGVFISYNENIMASAVFIKRICEMLNIAVHESISNHEQQVMKNNVIKAAYTNVLTGLPNLRGTSQWFAEFSRDEEHRREHLAVAIYVIPQQRDIYEKHGMAASEDVVSFVAEALQMANEGNRCFIGQISESEFLLIYRADDGYDIGKMINRCNATFYPLLKEYNVNQKFGLYVEVNCGCTELEPGWTPMLSAYVQSATAEMYKNRLIYGADGVKREIGRAEEQRMNLDLFNMLLEKNMFSYAYQPIIYVETGEIYAYEALMRTDPVIGMNPLQVLDAAKDSNRLYDVEKATLFNVMGQVDKENERFYGRKVFINSIPGFFLNEKDEKKLAKQYKKHFHRFVVEITEQNTLSEDELSRLKNLGAEESHNQIAIDDYGTGHSNIVNLMRYEPHVVKVDRFLITNIDQDRNKQMFLKSTVEFAKLNNIMVLAEGVETREELFMVIKLGVDLIQGYYTARPEFEPLDVLSQALRKDFSEARALR